MTPKVYIVTTGGTIAFRSKQNGTAVMDFKPEDLALELGLPEIELEFIDIFRKGSMNIIPEDWKAIAETIGEVSNKKPQGVVVLHGTDTVSYTHLTLPTN